MTMARRQVVHEGERAVYHCTARCVRRAFLCGIDAHSGKDYTHRRQWLQQRLRFLSGQCFTIDVLAYAAMSNHWHSVIRTRPEIAAEFSAEEVVRRWLRVFPKRRTGTMEEQRESLEREIRNAARNEDRVETLRGRLSSVSWFMKSMNEYIARRGNREDNVTGRFWEGRFRCQRLMDDAAILACMTYVDLNPIRAKLATSLEDSVFTSAYDRVQAFRFENRAQASGSAMTRDDDSGKCSGVRWVADVEGPDAPIAFLTERMYLDLLDVTGRRIRSGKRGVISPGTLSVLTMLDIDTEKWTQNVECYSTLFCRIAGRASHLVEAARRAGLKWFAGRHGAEALYRPSPRSVAT